MLTNFVLFFFLKTEYLNVKVSLLKDWLGCLDGGWGQKLTLTCHLSHGTSHSNDHLCGQDGNGEKKTQTQWHTWPPGCREHVSSRLSPAVLCLHAETLQTSVTCVKRGLEISVNHHLLRSRFQHVEHLRGGCSNKHRLNSRRRLETSSSQHRWMPLHVQKLSL